MLDCGFINFYTSKVLFLNCRSRVIAKVGLILYKTDAQALVKRYPKLHQYIQERFDNHEYKLAQDGFFTAPGCFNSLKYENVMDDGIDTVALKLLTNECL